jgi:hypothetical protein
MLMMITRSKRGLVALGFALALVAGACGSSSTTSNPFGGLPGGLPSGVPGGGGGGGGGGTSLTSGLSSNLDKLTSYKFSWTFSGSSTGTQASPGDSGTFAITGIVVNKPTKAVFVDSFGLQQIQIGTQSWISTDSGVTWMVDSSPTDLTDMLPTKDYASMFDTNATGFKAVGDESKNGVQTVHYKGDSSLGALYKGVSGVSASFQADLWVAKDGNYPVSGVYGITATSGGQGGAFGYSFDITNINDSSNTVTAPTNVATP